jgi:hypothetical protein
LDNAHEFFADALRLSAIEPKYILIEVILEIFRLKTTLEGATYKSLDQGSDQMSTIKAFIVLGSTLFCFLMTPLVLFNKVVTSPGISGNPATRFNIAKDKFF